MASEQIEEYLETIGRLEERDEMVTTSSLARERKVSLPSVTEMLRRLSERGLVTHEPRGEIALTEEGRSVARSVMRRHRLWERFLHDVLGMELDRVHLEACRLEHATSQEVETGLARVIGDSRACPHGRAIPPGDGAAVPDSGDAPLEDALPQPALLTELAPGETGTIEGLTAGKGSVTRYLALGFTPGTDVTMIQNPRSGPLVVLVRDTRVALGRGEARKIYVARKAQPVDRIHQPGIYQPE